MEKRTTDKVDIVMLVMIIMRGIRAGLISADDVLSMLLDDGQVDTLIDAGRIVVNRFIMTSITEEQKRLFMDYHNVKHAQNDQDMAGRTDNDDYFANVRDLIMEADEEPDWPSL